MDFRLNKALYEANRLHERMGWQKKKPPYLPIEAIETVFRKKILVSSEDLGKEANGAIYLNPELRGVAVIQYNCDDLTTTRNATLAHELGHFVLGHLERAPQGRKLCRLSGKLAKNNFVEREANVFMAEFLVPLNVLGKLFPKDSARVAEADPRGFNEESDLLATKFCVSPKFIRKQLMRLDHVRGCQWGL